MSYGDGYYGNIMQKRDREYRAGCCWQRTVRGSLLYKGTFEQRFEGMKRAIQKFEERKHSKQREQHWQRPGSKSILGLLDEEQKQPESE